MIYCLYNYKRRRSSGKTHKNVNEVFRYFLLSLFNDKVFYLCQRAVTHPIAPLFNVKEQVWMNFYSFYIYVFIRT